MKLNFPKWMVLSVWSIKIIAAFAFYWVYAFHYGNGKLTEDAGAYLTEAEKLNSVRSESVSDYFILIFNTKGSGDLIRKHFYTYYSRFSRNDDPFGETRNHIRILSILLTLTLGNKVGLWLLLLFLNLTSMFYLFKKLSARIPISKLAFFLFLTPSLIFWTSSPLKESLTLTGLALIFAFIIEIKYSWKNWLWLAVGCILIISTKSYLLGLLGVSLATALIIYGIRTRKKSIVIGFIGFTVTAVLFGLPSKVLRSISNKQFAFKNIARGGIHLKNDTTYFYLPFEKRKLLKPVNSSYQFVLLQPCIAEVTPFSIKKSVGKFKLNAKTDTLELTYCEAKSASGFEIKSIDGSWMNLITSAPSAIINTFFRPFPQFNNFSFRDSALFIENLFFVILFTIGIRNAFKNSSIQKDISIGLIVFILFTALLIGWTTPISGAIVRYKIPIYLAIITVYLLTLNSKPVHD